MSFHQQTGPLLEKQKTQSLLVLSKRKSIIPIKACMHGCTHNIVYFNTCYIRITIAEERPTVSIMMAHVGCCCISSSNRIKKRKTRSVDCIVALKWNECQEQFERFLFSCAKVPFLFKEKLAIKRRRYSHFLCVYVSFLLSLH